MSVVKGAYEASYLENVIQASGAVVNVCFYLHALHARMPIFLKNI